MENLPLEITENLLSGLPSASRLLCREVCTTWKGLLPKPKKGLLYVVVCPKTDKIEAEFYFSEQDYANKVVNAKHVDDVEKLNCLGTLKKLDHGLIIPTSSSDFKNIGRQTFMVGSCNGLVCYASYASSLSCERNVYICNPVTGEHIQAPSKNWGGKTFTEPYKELAIGFGYKRSSNEYKVVRILHDNYRWRYRNRTIHVNTLQGGTHVWRSEIRTTETRLFSQLNIISLAGVFACGALHWIDQKNHNPRTVTFDLEQETFKLLPSMPFVGNDGNDIKNVGIMELGGNLCVLESARGKPINIWESSKYTDENGCTNYSPWVTKFSLAWEDYSWCAPSNGTCFLLYNAVLCSYDPETKTMRNLDETLKKLMDDCSPSIYTTTQAIPHVNSLVSFKAVMEEGWGKKRKRKLLWKKIREEKKKKAREETEIGKHIATVGNNYQAS